MTFVCACVCGWRIILRATQDITLQSLQEVLLRSDTLKSEFGT
jgi:hypothetical protein